jgi:hypothetical protein
LQAVQGDGLVCHTGLDGFDSHRLLEASRALLWPLRADVSWSTHWSSKPGHRVRFPLPARSKISAALDRGRSTTASRTTRLCRSRPRDRAGDVHPPQDVRSWTAAREIPAKLVVAGMTSNGGPHRGSGDAGMRVGSISIRRRLRSWPTSLARGAPLRGAAAKARRTATAAGVATHRYLGPKLSQVERPFVKRMGAGSNPAGPATETRAASAGHRRGRSRAAMVRLHRL